MTLVDRLAWAIAKIEGFFVTPEEAAARRLRHPTRAQRNANPGNIRRWTGAGGWPYPQNGGFVDFYAWAAHRGLPPERGVEEGWRVLKVLIARYIEGRFHNRKSPTLYEMFAKYAPDSDGNSSRKYAEAVAKLLKINPDKPLKEVEND
jgi:hypothetical protein